jgi:cell division protein FtsB
MTIETILAILISILIGLSSWTLYTVHGLAVRNAARDEKEKAQDQTLEEDRARIIDLERDVRDLQLDMAAIDVQKKN